MRNMRIAVKLSFGFGLVLLIFALAVGYGWKNIRAVRADSELLAGGVSESMLLAGRVERDFAKLFYAMRGYRYVEDRASLEDARQIVAQLREDLDKGTKMLQDDSRLTSLKNVEEILSTFEPYVKNLEEAAQQTEAKHKSIELLAQRGTALQNVLAELIALEYEEAKVELQNGGLAALAKRLVGIHTSENLLFQVTELRRRYFAGMFNRDVKALHDLAPLIEKIEEDCRDLMAASYRPAILEKLGEAAKLVSDYRATLTTLIQDYENLYNTHENRQEYRADLDKNSMEMSVEAQQWTQKVGKDSAAELGSAIITLISLTLVAIIAGVLVAFAISRIITRPLKTIVNLAERAKDGDLTITKEDFRYSGRDEPGVLVEALSEMIAAQRESVRQVIRLSDDLTGGADTLSAASTQSDSSMQEVRNSVISVATLCESNSAALQQCNAGIEEMSAGAMTSAQSSTACAEFIAHTTEVSGSAVVAFQDTIKDMARLHAKSQESEKKIQDLVVSVEQISEFVNVITSIANQTNLLALNAAIEAARAGDAGRGFAVVAEEVRKLAEDSGRAAKNVETLIASLQGNAEEAIAATSESAEIVKATLSKAGGAKDALGEAMAQIDKANDSIQNIAAVAQEQAAASREVAAGIDQATRSTMDMVQSVEMIRNAADETAKASNEVAAQAGEMHELAFKLKNALSGFRVESEGNKPALKG